MEIDDIRVGDAAVLAIKGRVDSATSTQLKDRIEALVKRGVGRVALDFREVQYISSAGFRVLLIGARLAEDARGRLVLCSVSADVRRLFEIAALNELFAIAASREEALALLDATSA